MGFFLCSSFLGFDVKVLQSYCHPDVDLKSSSKFTRKTARALILNGDDVLLMYTHKYDDYSFPGGGLENHEDIVTGLLRELQEETGAQNITNIQEFGLYEEYRPWYKEDFDVIHILSYCFTCNVDLKLGENKLEDYEIKNGMTTKWVNIHKALAYNHQTMTNSPKKGMSLQREIFLLEALLKSRESK